MPWIGRFITVVLTFFAVFGAHVAGGQDKTITVFAAASMTNALNDINAAFTKSTGIKVIPSYGASSALIKQIEEGAPADVFASADLDWMDYGSQKKVIKDDTRINLLGNQLVLIAAKDSRSGRALTWPNSRVMAGLQLAMSERCQSGNMPRQPWKNSDHGTLPLPSSR